MQCKRSHLNNWLRPRHRVTEGTHIGCCVLESLTRLLGNTWLAALPKHVHTGICLVLQTSQCQTDDALTRDCTAADTPAGMDQAGVDCSSADESAHGTLVKLLSQCHDMWSTGWPGGGCRHDAGGADRGTTGWGRGLRRRVAAHGGTPAAHCR